MGDALKFMATTYTKGKHASQKELNIIWADSTYRTIAPVIYRELSNFIEMIETDTITRAAEK